MSSGGAYSVYSQHVKHLPIIIDPVLTCFDSIFVGLELEACGWFWKVSSDVTWFSGICLHWQKTSKWKKTSGFQVLKSPLKTRDLLRLGMYSRYIFMPLEWSKNIVVSDSAVTEHDHKQKSPVWNFLSDQQTAWIRFPKTRLRHRSWPPMNLGRGVSRVFLYLFMIRVYISPQAQVFAVYSSPPTADVGGKTKRDGWTAFCDRPWPGYSILGLPQDLYPFIKPGPIDHL